MVCTERSQPVDRIEVYGGCHCGAVSYCYHSPLALHEIPVRACDCSFCTKHAALYTSHPEGLLEISLREQESLSGYRFGTETGEAMFCRKCGVYLFMFCTIDQKRFAALNVNSFHDFDLYDKEIPRLQLSDDPVEERLNRRRKFWIPNVRLTVK